MRYHVRWDLLGGIPGVNMPDSVAPQSFVRILSVFHLEQSQTSLLAC